MIVCSVTLKAFGGPDDTKMHIKVLTKAIHSCPALEGLSISFSEGLERDEWNVPSFFSWYQGLHHPTLKKLVIMSD